MVGHPIPKWIRLLAFMTIFAGIPTSNAADPAIDLTSKDPYPGAGWQIARTPETYGWSSKKLNAARAFAEKIGTAALVIVDGGVIVAQWGGIAHKYPIYSIRKPLLSALIGIHVHENRLNLSATLQRLGIDDINPTLTGAEKQATVADLLKSRSGVYHPAVGETDMMKRLRPRRESHAPGTFWYYNNWDFNALGTIFENETQTGIFEAFAQRIAQPLQMEDFHVNDGRYFRKTESLHPVYAFRMSARDLARFGLLYLRRGNWNGRQIVPSDWVDISTTRHSDIGSGRGYGYMWRTAVNEGLAPNVHLKTPCFYHSGALRHYLVVIPHRELVIVHRAKTQGYAPGPFPQMHQIGRLFWMVLAAAGETDIGDNPSLDTAQGIRLTATKLTEFLTTRQFEVHLPSGLIEGGDTFVTIDFKKDHTIVFSATGGPIETGKWEATDKGCCIASSFTTGCFTVLKDKQWIRLFDSTHTRFASLRQTVAY